MTVREKIEEMISSADKDVVKGSVKAIFGSLVMAFRKLKEMLP